MKIEKTDIDALNAILTVTIEKDDYLPKVQQELKKTQKSAGLKGFRKGKTPMRMVKKLYGKAMLIDAVNENLQKGISDYLKEADFEILAQPLEFEDQVKYEFDVDSSQDYAFKFELGLEPDITVVGADENTLFVRQIPEVSDKLIDEEIELTQKRAGAQVEVDDTIQEEDLVQVEAVELEGDEKKENGHTTGFMVMMNTLSDEYKEALLKLKNGDTFVFDVFKFEKDRTDDYVKRYLLSIEDKEAEYTGGPIFEGKITSVKRLKPAEKNAEFFKEMFGPDSDVSDEDSAREKLKEMMQDYYSKEADKHLFKEFQKELMAQNEMELPEGFLKKWVTTISEDASPEKIESEFPEFLVDTKWRIIKSKLAKRFDLATTEDEVKRGVVDRVFSYYGQYGMSQDQLMDMAKRALSSQSFVQTTAEEILEGKIFQQMKTVVKVEDQVIDMEAFKSLGQPSVEEEE
jgi:trigger factor